MELQSFEGKLLIKLQDYITLKVPEIKYINLDLGQLEVYDYNSPSVAWPCCLIDFNETSFSDLHQGVQMADVAFIGFRLGFNPFHQSSSIQNTEVRKLALNYFEIEHKFFQAMQGFTADGMCQPFTRVKKGTEKREDDVFRVRPQIYSTSYEDDSAAPLKSAIAPTMELNLSDD